MVKKACPSHCRGFTLTELAIVMGVIGAIMGAIWWAASNAHELEKENNAFTELQTISQNIITLMQGHEFSQGQSSVITSTMLTAGAIPTTYANIGNSATCGTAGTCKADQPWSPKNLIIYANPGLTPPTRIFRVSFYNVGTQQGCVGLITQATACQVGQSDCPIDVVTDEGAYLFTAPAVSAGGWQSYATASNITSWCAKNSYNGGLNSVEFDFSL